MNILNVAMTARAFLYFAYPAQISGDQVWTYLGDKTPVDGGPTNTYPVVWLKPLFEDFLFILYKVTLFIFASPDHQKYQGILLSETKNRGEDTGGKGKGGIGGF